MVQVKSRLLANIAVRTTHRTPHISNSISKRNKQYPNDGVSATNATRDAKPIEVWYVHVCRFDNGDQMASHIIYSNMHWGAFVPLSLCIVIITIIAICTQHRVITNPRCFQFMIRVLRCIYKALRASSPNQSRFDSWELHPAKKWNERMRLFRLGIIYVICATSRTARLFGIDRNSISVHRSQFATCSNNVRHVQLYQRILPKFILSWKMCQTHIHTHARAAVPSTIRPCTRERHSINNNLQCIDDAMKTQLNQCADSMCGAKQI